MPPPPLPPPPTPTPVLLGGIKSREPGYVWCSDPYSVQVAEPLKLRVSLCYKGQCTRGGCGHLGSWSGALPEYLSGWLGSQPKGMEANSVSSAL